METPFEVTRAPGEVIDIEPGRWVYREDPVGYTQQVFGLKTGIFGGGGNLVFNRFTGPGRVGLQSAISRARRPSRVPPSVARSAVCVAPQAVALSAAFWAARWEATDLNRGV